MFPEPPDVVVAPALVCPPLPLLGPGAPSLDELQAAPAIPKLQTHASNALMLYLATRKNLLLRHTTFLCVLPLYHPTRILARQGARSVELR